MEIATKGEVKQSVSFRGPKAYLFTALCLREIAANILNGNYTPGFQTPAYFGKELLDGIGSIEKV
jgi:hypothetical protein